MKCFANIIYLRRLVVMPVFAMALYGCEGGGLVLTDSELGNNSVDSVGAPGITADDETTERPVVVGSPVSIVVDSDTDSIAAEDDVETGEPVVIDSPESSTVDSDSDTITTDNDASNGAVASAFLADRTALGAVKIMAVGDSITQGVAGVSSYRREFTALLAAESCSFTMVGSQLTSQSSDDSSVVYTGAHEGYAENRADHFLTGYVSPAVSNPGIRVSMETFVPDVVLLHLGSFDLFDEQSVSNALIDLDDVLDSIYEVQPETLVLMANVIPWFSDKPYEGIGRDIERLGDGVQRIVDERFDPFLKLVDVRSGFTESMMLDDLIHPNASGERHIADAFANVYQSFADCSL